MPVSDAFRRILEELDVAGARALWAQLRPGLPQPKDDAEALMTLHIARTASEAMPLKLRAWSHRWLVERGLPSQLPDALKPEAERLYPRVVEAVGVSVNFSSAALKPAGRLIERAIGAAIADAYANGDTDVATVKRRMAEARAAEMKSLFGSVTLPAAG